MNAFRGVLDGIDAEWQIKWFLGSMKGAVSKCGE